jgi:hypothetical protein
MTEVPKETKQAESGDKRKKENGEEESRLEEDDIYNFVVKFQAKKQKLAFADNVISIEAITELVKSFQEANGKLYLNESFIMYNIKCAFFDNRYIIVLRPKAFRQLKFYDYLGISESKIDSPLLTPFTILYTEDGENKNFGEFGSVTDENDKYSFIGKINYKRDLKDANFDTVLVRETASQFFPCFELFTFDIINGKTLYRKWIGTVQLNDITLSWMLYCAVAETTTEKDVYKHFEPLKQ